MAQKADLSPTCVLVASATRATAEKRMVWPVSRARRHESTHEGETKSESVSLPLPPPASPPRGSGKRTIAMTAAPAPVTTLPLIDISPFLIPSTSAVRVQCAAAVHAAILEYGFFLINGLESVLSTEDLTTSLAVTREFFAQPAADKVALSIQPGDGARGMTSPHSTRLNSH